MAIYFFTLKKILYKDMLFTKSLASNERLKPTKSFSEVVTQNSATERCHLGAGNVCVMSKSSA